jgi:hypothetical protein
VRALLADGQHDAAVAKARELLSANQQDGELHQVSVEGLFVGVFLAVCGECVGAAVGSPTHPAHPSTHPHMHDRETTVVRRG